MRHYGLKVGDKVVESAFGRERKGEVIHLYRLDNNRCRLRLEDGREVDAVCEWCKPQEESDEKLRS